MTQDLLQDIADVINRHPDKIKSCTPDYIIAGYLLDCLTAFELADRRRSTHFRIENENNKWRD